MNSKSLIPKLTSGQRAVIFAEVDTGILLTPDGQRHTGVETCYKLFNSEEEALSFAKAYVEEHPKIECSIRDENGNHIRFISK
jgi:hypothetical protein